MFWDCFCWDKKGPCHIWTKETAAERKKTDKELKELNIAFEPELKMLWEIETGVRCINLRQLPPGKRSQWKLTKANGKLVREGRTGGIDWYRY